MDRENAEFIVIAVGNSEEADDLRRGLYLASEGVSLTIQASVSHNYRLLYMSATSKSANKSLICSMKI